MSGVKNPKYIQIFRGELNHIRNIFITIFAITTVLFMLSYYLDKANIKNGGVTQLFQIKNTYVNFDMSIFSAAFILLSIAYYIYNFKSLQDLSYDIADQVNKESEI